MHALWVMFAKEIVRVLIICKTTTHPVLHANYVLLDCTTYVGVTGFCSTVDGQRENSRTKKLK